MGEFFELSLDFMTLTLLESTGQGVYEIYVKIDLVVVFSLLIEGVHFHQGHHRGTVVLFSVSLVWRTSCQSVMLPVMLTLNVAKVEAGSFFLDRDIFTLVIFAFQRGALRLCKCLVSHTLNIVPITNFFR